MTSRATVSMLVVGSLAACSGRGEAGARRQALEEAAPVEDDDVGPVEVVGVGGWAGDPNDMDRDGVPAEIDLDDGEELVGWVLAEVHCDGIDQDGDHADTCPVDADADGVSSEQDCDDLDTRVSPLVPEEWCNGLDENCNGVDDCDRDVDGLRDVDDPEPDLAATAPARAEISTDD